MRLGTCIALELTTGVLALSAAAWGVAFAAGAIRGPEGPARTQVAAIAPPASRTPRVGPDAALPPAPPAQAPGSAGSGSDAGTGLAIAATVDDPNIEIEPSELDAGATAGPAAPGAELDPVWTFIDQPDEVLLAPLRTGTIKLVKFNGGGSTLSIRLELEDGSKAAFKPDQIYVQSQPRKELAAYRIDRLLGLGRVPPCIARAFPMRELMTKVASTHREYAHRLVDEAVPHGGVLRGSVSWWIPVLGVGHVEGKYKIDSAEGVNRWKQWLHVDTDIPPDEVRMCRELSNVTVFDFLIDNLDRWSGGNAITTEDGSTLYSMDNQMAFSADGEGHKKSQVSLERVEKFSRGLITRVRALDRATLHKILAPDLGPFERLLSEAEVTAVLERKDVLLAYVDDLIARHGEAKVLAFP